jgi:glycogen operon protein
MLRRKQRRNFLTTLFLSQGVPMLLGGDEFGRTQKGNNNAYCHDNEMSWFNWARDEKQNQLFEFTKKLIQLRKNHPVFRRPKFFQGRRVRGSEIRDVMWFNPGGNEMSKDEWESPFVRCLGMLLSGDTIDVLSFESEPIRDETFLLLINTQHETIPFVLPGGEHIEWELILDTATEEGFLAATRKFASGDDVDLGERAACLLKLTQGAQAQARLESWKKRRVELPPAVTAEEERGSGKKSN